METVFRMGRFRSKSVLGVAILALVLPLVGCVADGHHVADGDHVDTPSDCGLADVPETISDHSGMSDGELSNLATRFSKTWRDFAEDATTPSTELAHAMVCELTSIGVSPYLTMMKYHPELESVMVLGGGGSVAVAIVDRNNEPVPGLNPLDYFKPSQKNAEFEPIDEKALEIEDNGYRLKACSTGHLIRVSDGVWASVVDDINGKIIGGVTQELVVDYRDVRNATC